MALAVGVTASQARSVLPDGRGYELVSPPAKNGGDVTAQAARTHAAADGSAVAFSSLAGFGQLQSTGLLTQYVSERQGVGSTAWVTHAVTPRQVPGALASVSNGASPAFIGEWSGDLERAVFQSWAQLAPVANVEGVPNLYLGDTLRSSPARPLTLLTAAFAPVAISGTPPFLAGASSDFTHVAFESRLQLTASAPPGTAEKLYEWADGVVRLVGVLADGTPAVGGSQAGLGAASKLVERIVSNDGARVFFQERATGNLFVRVDGTSTEQLNASEKTAPEAQSPAILWTASVDGMRAFFTTEAGLVDGDDDGRDDVYMYDATKPAGSRLTLVSRDSEPGDMQDSTLTVLGASADGGYIYFVHTGQLVAGEELGISWGLYVWHDGAIAYIGRFASPEDPTLNSPDAAWRFDRLVKSSRITPDGRQLVFISHASDGFTGRGGFSGYDHGNACKLFVTDIPAPCRELYVYSSDSGRLACVSCNPTGAKATADPWLQVRVGTSGASATTHLSRALSDDGRFVFFSTREALVQEDANGKSDAYEYDVTSGKVHLLSSGTSTDDSYFLDASASGRDVFFVTTERLVGWDRDNNYDLYDARVAGGVPEPVIPPPACVGDACQGSPATGSVPGVAASIVSLGAGNLLERLRPFKQAARRCRSGAVPKRVRGRRRCVRRGRAHGTGAETRQRSKRRAK